MSRFLKENWLWIAIPIVVVALIFVVLVIMQAGQADESPFDYPIF